MGAGSRGKACAGLAGDERERSGGVLIDHPGFVDQQEVAPGEIGMAFIYFEAGNDIPDSGATYEFKAETTEADTSSYNTAPLVVEEVNRSGSKIVGSATNNTGKPLTGPYSTEAYCFDGDKITGRTGSFAEEDGDIDAGATVSFTIDLYDTGCKTFAVGASGYFS